MNYIYSWIYNLYDYNFMTAFQVFKIVYYET